jgi:hypothetical protein
MILAFDLEPEFESTLENDAKQKHISTSEMIKNFLLQNYFCQKQSTESLTDDEQNTQQLIKVKARYSSELLVRELRDEKIISPITQSLIGLLANSNLDESLTDWDNAEFTEMAMNQAMRGMENEPALYTLDDLKERWQ